MGLPSSQCTSMHMPRLDNPADSSHPHQFGCFTWTSSTLQLWSVEISLFSGRCQHFRITAIPVAYALLCVRFTCLVHPIIWSRLQTGKYFAILEFRHRRNTRYGWLVRPYPTGTCTLQGAPSFAWRTNAAFHQWRVFLRHLSENALLGDASIW